MILIIPRNEDFVSSIDVNDVEIRFYIPINKEEIYQLKRREKLERGKYKNMTKGVNFFTSTEY